MAAVGIPITKANHQDLSQARRKSGPKPKFMDKMKKDMAADMKKAINNINKMLVSLSGFI